MGKYIDYADYREEWDFSKPVFATEWQGAESDDYKIVEYMPLDLFESRNDRSYVIYTDSYWLYGEERYESKDDAEEACELDDPDERRLKGPIREMTEWSVYVNRGYYGLSKVDDFETEKEAQHAAKLLAKWYYDDQPDFSDYFRTREEAEKSLADLDSPIIP